MAYATALGPDVGGSSRSPHQSFQTRAIVCHNMALCLHVPPCELGGCSSSVCWEGRACASHAMFHKSTHERLCHVSARSFTTECGGHEAGSLHVGSGNGTSQHDVQEFLLQRAIIAVCLGFVGVALTAACAQRPNVARGEAVCHAMQDQTHTHTSAERSECARIWWLIGHASSFCWCTSSASPSSTCQ